jgi:hypothetical protein
MVPCPLLFGWIQQQISRSFILNRPNLQQHRLWNLRHDQLGFPATLGHYSSQFKPVEKAIVATLTPDDMAYLLQGLPDGRG